MEALVYHSEPLICEDHLNLNDPEINENFNSNKLFERGVMQFGCQHYHRRCRIRAPCCNEVFDCRHCHNEAKNSINVESVHRHNLPRHEVQKVICSLCGTEQMASNPCIEWALLHDCPVCFEYLFESINDVSVLPCVHTIHSVCDMSKVLEKLDIEIAATPMPDLYHNLIIIKITNANDCGVNSEVKFHIVAQKCLNCKSYNTPPDQKTCRHTLHNLL
ncbi:Zn-finger protein [Dioscorea alata]|uniref:Zn-finger protein n=1 Tax=Dioscorea alata TaxID=55571 RepID=A0ACB7W363_DIOAL|nr:Zn-finger protein [Dioscorea alata]